MNKKGKKSNYKEFITAIRCILLEDWDPIGVGNNPYLSDEYDRYISLVANKILTNTKAEDIKKFLQQIETEEMGGATSSDNNLYKVAFKLKNCIKLMPPSNSPILK